MTSRHDRLDISQVVFQLGLANAVGGSEVAKAGFWIGHQLPGAGRGKPISRRGSLPSTGSRRPAGKAATAARPSPRGKRREAEQRTAPRDRPHSLRGGIPLSPARRRAPRWPAGARAATAVARRLAACGRFGAAPARVSTGPTPAPIVAARQGCGRQPWPLVRPLRGSRCSASRRTKPTAKLPRESLAHRPPGCLAAADRPRRCSKDAKPRIRGASAAIFLAGKRHPRMVGARTIGSNTLSASCTTPTG